MAMAFHLSYVLAWVLLGFQTAVAVGLLSQVRDLTRRMGHGTPPRNNHLPLGTTAVDFTGPDLRSGDAVHFVASRQSQCILLFLSPSCAICRKLASSVHELHKALGDLVIPICHGSEDDCRANILHFLQGDVKLVFGETNDVASLYGVNTFPTAVLVSQGRVTRYWHPSKIDDIQSIPDTAERDNATNPFVSENGRSAV